MREYIITFAGAVNARLLADYGAVDVYIPKHLTFIALCHLDEDRAESLRSEEEVKAVECDEADYSDAREVANVGSYANQLLEVSKFHALGIKGQGIKVAVFDSGIQEHVALNIVGGINAYDRTKPYSKNIKNSHGTMVAGVLAANGTEPGSLGVAPECELYAVKLDDNAGSNNGSRWSEQIIGMNWAIDNDIDVINCSFSGFTESVARRSAFKAAHDAGITIFCSAGNKQTGTSTKVDTMGYPARYPFVVTSANIRNTKVRYGSSCVGSKINFSGGGVSVTSTTTDSSKLISESYRSGTGTSYASPSVAGMFILYKQLFPDYSREQVLQSMYVNAERIGDSWLYGAGIPKFPHKEFNTIQIKEKEGAQI